MKFTTKAILSIGICAAVYALHFCSVVDGAKVCKPGYKGYRYVEDADGAGRCEKCLDCGPGKEWSRTAEVPTSEYGALHCPPCVPCRDGYYKESDSTSRRCNRCLLNCYQMNRLEGMPCGGTMKGFCNSCLPGYKETVPDIYNPCMRDRAVTTSLAVTTPRQLPGVSPRSVQLHEEVTTTAKEIPEIQRVKESHLPKHHSTGPPIWVYLVILFIGSGAVGAVGCRKRIRALCQQTHKIGESSKHLLDKSGLGTDGPEISSGKHEPLGPEVSCQEEVLSVAKLMESADDRLDVDANSESSSLDADSAEAIEGLEVDGPAEGTKIRIPHLRLHKDHEALDVVAGKTYPEKDYQLFRNLQLHEADWKPEWQLYYFEQKSYKNFILKVLIVWIQKAGDGATLDVLVEAVQQAGFIDIANELRQTYGSEPQADRRPAIQDGVHQEGVPCRAELPQGRSLQDDTRIDMENKPCRGEFLQSEGAETVSDANRMARIPVCVSDESLASLYQPSLYGAFRSTKL